jgi:hypothetical protein
MDVMVTGWYRTKRPMHCDHFLIYCADLTCCTFHATGSVELRPSVFPFSPFLILDIFHRNYAKQWYSYWSSGGYLYLNTAPPDYEAEFSGTLLKCVENM